MNIIPIFKRWVEIPFHHRTLFWGFVSNEVKGRFAGSMGGFLWSLLTPLANLLIYIFVFSMILKIRLKPMETGTGSFAVYFLAGLLPWTAFSESLNSATDVFLSRANLITKVAFPIEILPLAGVVVPFCLNGLGFGMYLVYLSFLGYAHVGWFWLVAAVPVHMLFTLGLVVLISSLSVFLRDVRQFMGTALSLWFFSTPIIYPLSMVPGKFQWIIKLNPMYPFVELYHQILVRHSISWSMLVCATGLALLSFISGCFVFLNIPNMPSQMSFNHNPFFFKGHCHKIEAFYGEPPALNAVQVEDLSKHYRVYLRPFDRLKEAVLRQPCHERVEALNDVSFTVPAGDTLGIIGENGAGKSTLLKILAGTVSPTRG